MARALALFAIGCGLTWWRAERMEGVRLARPVVVRFTERIERVEPLPARDTTRLLPIGDATLPARIRLTIAQENVPPGLAQGGIVAARARLMPSPSAAVPGTYDYAATAWFQGISATGKALEPVRAIGAAPANRPADWLADTRATLSAHIVARLPGAAGVVADALVTGDMGAIPQADAFRRSGLAHLLSVSGLH